MREPKDSELLGLLFPEKEVRWQLLLYFDYRELCAKITLLNKEWKESTRVFITGLWHNTFQSTNPMFSIIKREVPLVFIENHQTKEIMKYLHYGILFPNGHINPTPTGI